MRNLLLLVPFLEEPRIELKSLRRVERPGRRWRWPALFGGGGGGGSGADAPQQLFAKWRLTCYVRLPWAPYVEVNGTTTYTLDEAASQVGAPSCGWSSTASQPLPATVHLPAVLLPLQIVSHVEAWDISPAQALLLLLRPSERAAWRRQRRSKSE